MSDLLETRLTAPPPSTLELVRRLCGNPAIMADQVVARSEYQHSARNAAIAYLMKACHSSFENGWTRYCRATSMPAPSA